MTNPDRRRSRYPVWVRIPAWIAGFAGLAAAILVVLAIAWPIFVPADPSRGAGLWAATLVATAVMIVAWITWAVLLVIAGEGRPGGRRSRRRT